MVAIGARLAAQQDERLRAGENACARPCMSSDDGQRVFERGKMHVIMDKVSLSRGARPVAV
jgi:hypothetical protein